MSKNYKFGDFYLDSGSRNLFNQSKLIRLSPRAFEILLLLIKKQGTAVEKNEIIQTVWSDSFVEENNLPVHISALRRVLGENISDTKYIETISGYGYRFLPAVEEVKIGNLSNLLQDHLKEEDEPRSLAILPFVNKSGDAKFDYLAEGIAESLILNLSQLSQLKVIAYSAVARFKESTLDLREIGFLLGVEAILIGSLAEFDETLEISVELIRVNNLFHLWGMQYQYKLQQLLKTRTEISVAIAEKLQLKLTKPEVKQLVRQPTENSDAYRFYLKGLNSLEKRNKKGFLKAIEFFNAALEIDAEFSLAYVGIAEVYVHLGHFFLIPTDRAILESNNAIKKALKFDNTCSEAHCVNGLLYLYSLDLKNAEQSFKRSIELNPNNSNAHASYSIYLTATGNFQEALDHQLKSIELNPFILARVRALSNRFCLMREYPKAIKNTEEILELFPNDDLAYFSLAVAYVHMGAFQLALKNIEISYNISERAESLALKGYIYAVSGNYDEVLKILNTLTSDSYPNPIDSYDIATIYSVLGNNDKAFEYLEKSYKSNFSHIFLLKVDPRFDSLHSDLRFETLLKKIGLA